MRLAILASALGLLGASLEAAETRTVRLAYVGPAAADASVGKGVAQGLEEAQTQGEFLGLEFQLDRLELAEAKVAEADAIFVAAEPTDILEVAKARPGVPVFNVSSRDPALRPQCLPNLFHTPPSQSMLEAAEEQWRQQKPEDAVEALAWHSDFVKFAGRELNNRFRKAWDVEMDGDAWAGWAALKLYSDAVAQNPGASAAELIDYLRNEMEFDGQKGLFLTFAETGQLRQPLLLTVDGELAGEAPVRGVADSDDLDSLGLETCQP